MFFNLTIEFKPTFFQNMLGFIPIRKPPYHIFCGVSGKPFQERN